MTPSQLELFSAETLATSQEIAEYDRLCAWRSAWGRLEARFDKRRLQSVQDRIQAKGRRSNARIRRFLHAFDVRVGNTVHTVNPVSPHHEQPYA